MPMDPASPAAAAPAAAAVAVAAPRATPQDEKQEINVGLSMQPKIGIARTLIVADLRDLTKASVDWLISLRDCPDSAGARDLAEP